MLGRACNKLVRNQALQRTVAVRQAPPQQVRHMGGGGKYMHVDQNDYNFAEVYGTIMWLWIFHRARDGLPIMYGFHYPWAAH